jgi:hypothetical protein
LTWDFLACSADGNKLEVTSAGALLPLSFTTNSGATWSFGGPMSWDSYAGGWAGICSSADGDKIFAVDGLFYASFDSGTTWTNPPSPMDLACIASSADGTKLIAGTEISYDGLYISTNAGASWTPSGPSNEIWGAVASSADGSKLVAAVYASSVLNNDGTDVYIGGPIYTSADSGVTWTPTAAPMTNWQSVASSADGTRLVAAVNGGPIYTSTNSGMTWGPAYVPSTNWQCVAMSADGNTMMATVQWGGVWVAQSTPSPQLNLTPSPTNIVLAWTVPSTNFGLQQSSDLVSWTDVTNSPVLNLTNLQDQVILPPCSRNSFYRLKTP